LTLGGHCATIQLHMTQDVFSALGDPTRRRLVTWLAIRPATATELAKRLPISRQAVTKHLAILDEARLIGRQRTGREVRYSLEAEPLASAGEWLATVSARWESRLQRMKQYVEAQDRG
jgi:DNA-binding transcriptional ArsR family regulator